MSRCAASYLLSCAAAFALLTLGCAGPFLAPNPPPPAAPAPTAPPPPRETPKPAPVKDVPKPKQEPPPAAPEMEVIDFTGAFDDGDAADEQFAEPVIIDTSLTQPSLRYPPYRLPKRPVRVMVRGGVRQAAIQVSGSAAVRAPKGNTSFKGRMQIEAVGGGSSVIATVNNAKREFRLPCTLFVSTGTDGQLRLGDERYRGSLVIVPDQNGTVMIINVLDVEDYLRGVVPLEIGNLKEPDIEAVKAQAVAARTYTYQRMVMRASNEFDLVNTVSDQVYGGANAEGLVPDMAIRLTTDLVMVHGEQLINAYYHSTCGGVTANIEDVWGSSPQPYLRSSPDTRPDGSAYCRESNWFAWEEKWSVPQMSGIVKRYADDGRVQPQYKGSTLRKLAVKDRFECGRVKTLQVTSNGGDFTAGGDKVRFLLRRNVQGNPILRSSLITDIKMTGGDVTIAGRGHGHGIGMCQVGAIHRARGGQTFENILGAYYSGVSIRTVTD